MISPAIDLDRLLKLRVAVDDLDLDSSDLLLVARLPKMARIFARAPSSKEPGIARIRDIAEAYLMSQGKVDPDT